MRTLTSFYYPLFVLFNISSFILTPLIGTAYRRQTNCSPERTRKKGADQKHETGKTALHNKDPAKVE